jgi:hypothetical protein
MMLKRLPILLCLLLCNGLALAQESPPDAAAARSFDTPEAAVAAFIAALEKGDTAAIAGLLGPGSEWLVDSGDAVQDASDRERFLADYRQGHALVEDGKASRTLEIGADRWPFPIPIVQRDGRWLLDGWAGADELVFRRIGRNELGAIAALRGFVDAQREYAAEGRDGDPPGIYAMKLFSDTGRQNGLYWPTAAGEPPSPVGEFVARAAAEGYRRSSAGYHGYQYRMLYRQGKNAPGGAREYFRDGLLTEGFALLAWPSSYGISGVMTFIVNQDGVVYQQDLGADTDARAAAITSFDPGKGWKRVD